MDSFIATSGFRLCNLYPLRRPHNSINLSFIKYYHLMSQSANISVTVSSSPPTPNVLPNTYYFSTFKEFLGLVWSKDWQTVLEAHSDGRQIWTNVRISLQCSFVSGNHLGMRLAWLHLARFLDSYQAIRAQDIVHQTETDSEIIWTFYLLAHSATPPNTQTPTDDEDSEPFFVPDF